MASDPAILVDGDTYWMYYTCFINDGSDQFAPENLRAAICAATSAGGSSWRTVDTGSGMFEGVVLRGREGEWDVNLEGAFAIKRGAEFLLYYSGYEMVGDPAMGYPAALAIARSTDGIHFERVSDEPALAPTRGGRDNDAVYSETIVEYEGGYAMVYAGHCYTDCDYGLGVSLLAATSEDGLVWQKLDQPVMTATSAGLDWTRDGVAEPGLVEGPDGLFYLGFTGLRDEERLIGIASSESPSGPWEISEDPIIEPTGPNEVQVLAPMMLIEGDRVRMWYLGVQDPEDFDVRYAEAPWPLTTDD